MRALFFLALTLPTAFAQEVCVGLDCLEPAVRQSLAEAGLREIEGLHLDYDSGAHSLTIVSRDEKGLSRISPDIRAQETSLPGLFAKTVPIDLSSFDLITLPGQRAEILYPGVYVQDVSGPTGGGSCEEVCVCTEDGPECWLEC